MLRDLEGESDLPATISVASPESERFGLRIGRINVAAGSSSRADELVACVIESDMDLVVLRYPASFTGWFAHFAASEWDAIHADSLVYWSVDIGRERAVRTIGRSMIVLDEFDPGATAFVDEAMADLFGNYGNHYSANPLLPRALALEGYQEWARSRLSDGGVIVLLDRDGSRTAVSTIAVDGSRCEIELAGVLPGHRGKGEYAKLLSCVAEVAAERHCDEIVISTQVHNIVAQRGWTSFGMRPRLAVHTVHLLRPGLLS